MSIKGTAIKLGIVSAVLLLFTGIIVIVFGQFRFESTTSYTAMFSNASGLKEGEFVRAGGVEVGKVSAINLTEDGRRVLVKMDVDKSLPIYQSTTATVRYLDLIGNRYVNLERGTGEGADNVLPPGGLIPLARTQPALDLDALIGGFKPLFKSLDPEKVNNIATSLVTVFQGQGGTIADILNQTAQLTSTLADYLVPMAFEMPDIVVDHVHTPVPGTLLGAKGLGEAGTIGAVAALGNAVNDALAPLGARLDRQPYTPMRVLRALGRID